MSIARIEEALRKAKESKQSSPDGSASTEPHVPPSTPEPRVAPVYSGPAPVTPAARPAMAPPPAMQFRFSDGRSVAVPLSRLRNNRIVTAKERYKYAAGFRDLTAHLKRGGGDGGAAVIAVVSSNPREGRTLGAINLALTLASAGAAAPVVLVDMDFFKPAIHAYFDLQPAAGLKDVIEGRKTIEDVLIRADADRLVLVPSGYSSRDHQAKLTGDTLAMVVAGLRAQFPVSTLVIDLPPLSAKLDPSLLASSVDQVLLVVEEGKTLQEDVRISLEKLKSAKHVVIALNKSVESDG